LEGSESEIQEMKVCNKCKTEYPNNEQFFYKRYSTCKSCVKIQTAKYIKENALKIKEREHEKYLANQEYYKRRSSELYYLKHDEIKEKRRLIRNLNKEKINAQKREYNKIRPELKYKHDLKYRLSKNGMAKTKERRERNRKKDNEMSRIYQKRKRAYDPKFKLLTNIRTRINQAIKKNYKMGHAIDLMGCTVEFLKKYLESKFTDGMSWENYGQWHIDHIYPCSSFDLDMPDQQKKCFHFSNLQFLWAIDNLKKHAKIPTV